MIDDARQRQRRRRLVGSAFAVAAIVTVVVALDPFTARRFESSSRPLPFVAPSKAFSQSPYMGVTCRVPNSTVCDDIGLAVWLRRPAIAVRAEIQGRWFSLDDRQWSGPVHRQRRTMFAGFLRGAGLRGNFHLPAHWEGQPARNPRVRVRIDYGNGSAVETRVRVGLMAGWG